MAALEGLEKKTGKGFGDAKNPLLVSVRSGAAVSMPGMMDTVLNLGLTDETARGMAEATQNPTLCLRFLPPVHPDVCQRGDGAGYDAV